MAFPLLFSFSNSSDHVDTYLSYANTQAKQALIQGGEHTKSEVLFDAEELGLKEESREK